MCCVESPNPEQIHLLAYCRYEATLYTHHLPSEPALYVNVNAYFQMPLQDLACICFFLFHFI